MHGTEKQRERAVRGRIQGLFEYFFKDAAPVKAKHNTKLLGEVNRKLNEKLSHKPKDQTKGRVAAFADALTKTLVQNRIKEQKALCTNLAVFEMNPPHDKNRCNTAEN